MIGFVFVYRDNAKSAIHYLLIFIEIDGNSKDMLARNTQLL